MAALNLGNGTLFIDGKWRHATSGVTFASRDPATSDLLGMVSDAGPGTTRCRSERVR